MSITPSLRPARKRRQQELSYGSSCEIAACQSECSEYDRGKRHAAVRRSFQTELLRETRRMTLGSRATEGDEDARCETDLGSTDSDGDERESDDSWDDASCSKDKAREALRRAAEKISAISSNGRESALDALAGPADCRNSLVCQRRGTIIDSMACGCINAKEDYLYRCDDPLSRSASFSALKEYQRVGVRWLLALHSCVPGMVLADEMGLGKTLQSLCFLEVIATEKPSLVIAPASLLDNWEAEAARWTPSMRVLKYHSSDTDFSGRERLRKAFFAQGSNYHLVLATPNALHGMDDRTFFFRRIHFEYLIYDEAHTLKTSRTKAYRDLTKVVRCNKRLLLTGTPIQNSLDELATLLGFALSSNGDMELSQHLRTISLKPQARALRQMQAVSGPLILRRLKADVLSDLPAKRSIVVFCDLKAKQRTLYDEEMEVSRIRRHDDGGTVMEAFVKLRRVCLHPLLCTQNFSDERYSSFVDHLISNRPDFQAASRARVESEVHDWSLFDVHNAAVEYGLDDDFRASEEDLACSAKFAELICILRKQSVTGSKTLVFSQFLTLLDITEAALSAAGITCYRLDGTTAIDERHSLVSAFQGVGGPLVLLATTKTGGVGLNLTSANVVVMLDLDFNPQNMRQAEDRTHRIGQTRDVTCYYLICRGTVEEMMLRRSFRKMQLDASFGGSRAALEVVDAGGADSDEAKKRERLVLAELRELLKQGPKLERSIADEDDMPLSTLMGFSQLPEDAPMGHIAHSRVKRSNAKKLVHFDFRVSLAKLPFQVTVGQAGSWHSAEVIARACYLRFEQGWSKDQVTKFKKDCCHRITTERATTTKVMGEAAMGAANSKVSTVALALQPTGCDGVDCGAGGGVQEVGDSETSTECVLVCKRHGS